jgi:dihydrofolate reductase
VHNVIYLMNLSLDGFVEGPDGKFDWCTPDEEVHRFHNQQAGEMGAFLYGRRMYETMAVWQTVDGNPLLPDYVLEFAKIWKEKPKFVFSTKLGRVGENCKLVKGEIGAEIAAIQRDTGGDLAVSGPGLASALARLGLVDEYRLVVYPIVVGGGKRYFPAPDRPYKLRLLETRIFGCGAAYLRYQSE